MFFSRTGTYCPDLGDEKTALKYFSLEVRLLSAAASRHVALAFEIPLPNALTDLSLLTSV